MGYIVNLAVILDDIFRTTGGNVTENAALRVMGTHVRSGPRNSIHQDIRSFVEATLPNGTQQGVALEFAKTKQDVIMERIIDLIKTYCVPFKS